MEKLSKTQQEIYQKIKNYVKLAKECNTFKEYYIKEHCFGSTNESVIENETKRFEKYEEELTKDYKNYWLEAREQNIELVNANSSTLKSLEKKGLIKIVEDGGKYIDKVILI